MARTCFSTSMRSPEGGVELVSLFCLLGCVVAALVVFDPLDIIVGVASFFFGAMVTSGGMQHV